MFRSSVCSERDATSNGVFSSCDNSNVRDTWLSGKFVMKLSSKIQHKNRRRYTNWWNIYFQKLDQPKHSNGKLSAHKQLNGTENVITVDELVSQ